ncbi:hypothetical protein [Streptomyces atratus]|uniref:hypothetical protein n=1 Tax=Streptomyces atratus TaxID=1893 RepID=UPI0022526093|nr:hypothetical protein [Streptomyces atratus]MCX5343694.1 hypothetical protein [Streptomyces atratus]
MANNTPLASPGDPYQTWYELAPTGDVTSAEGQSQLDLPLLLELYQPKVPEAAFMLDYHIGNGIMPMRSGGNPSEIKWISCENFPGVTSSEVRRVMHELHIQGFLLINNDGSVSETIPKAGS